MVPRKLKILYSENDLDSREMISISLTDEGYDVVCPVNPRDVIRLAKEERFDAYLLDNWMPELSGNELCRQIREFDSHTPIIFYSGAAYQADKDAAFGSGAQAYITKPAPFEELADTILSAIQRSKTASA